MHFVDRSTMNPPGRLALFAQEFREAWRTYNSARYNNIAPQPQRPPSSWLHEDIRIPLKLLFLKNCGYCGIHTDTGNDAEVDHHFPTSRDVEAEFVFSWENYVWSCPSCNGIKKHNFPILNPCNQTQMDSIFFHSADGRYLAYQTANEEIKRLFEATEKFTNLNGKNRPDKRKYIYRDVVENHLSGLLRAYNLYQVECDVRGEHSVEAQDKLMLFVEKKERLLELIKCGDFLFLMKHAFEEFCKNKNATFPFSFDMLISESEYI